MRVRLVIHLERVPDGVTPFAWWAESPELPGFSAAADHLPELLERAYAAIPDVLGEEGRDPAVEIEPVLAMSNEAAGTSVERAGREPERGSPGARHVVLTAT